LHGAGQSPATSTQYHRGIDHCVSLLPDAPNQAVTMPCVHAAQLQLLLVVPPLVLLKAIDWVCLSLRKFKLPSLFASLCPFVRVGKREVCVMPAERDRPKSRLSLGRYAGPGDIDSSPAKRPALTLIPLAPTGEPRFLPRILNWLVCHSAPVDEMLSGPGVMLLTPYRSRIQFCNVSPLSFPCTVRGGTRCAGELITFSRADFSVSSIRSLPSTACPPYE